MCMQLRRACQCGRQSAALNCRDNLLPAEILVSLYCPACRDLADGSPECRVEDCGWILEYDLDGAQIIMAQKGIRQEVTAAFIFDEGYLSWQGLAPGDHQVNHEIHERLAPLIAKDMKQYLEQLKTEWLAHVTRLKAQGWRKAQQA